VEAEEQDVIYPIHLRRAPSATPTEAIQLGSVRWLVHLLSRIAGTTSCQCQCPRRRIGRSMSADWRTTNLHSLSFSLLEIGRSPRNYFAGLDLPSLMQLTIPSRNVPAPSQTLVANIRARRKGKVRMIQQSQRLSLSSERSLKRALHRWSWP
jgi:hypothetical protein